jgi:hypothetical protein
MSTKTISKRVALATVVALGAGVLSLVSVSSANAAVSLNVAANATDGLTASAAQNQEASAGLIAQGTGTNLAETATLSAAGTLAVQYVAGATFGGISVSGGTITAASTDGGAGTYVVTGGTLVTVKTTGTTLSALIKPNAGVTSMTVSMYKGLASAATTTSAGTLEKLLTVAVASTSVADVLSLTNTKTYYNPTTVNTVKTSGYTGADVASSNYATSAFFTVAPRDAYNTVLTSAHFVQVSATNGALVSISNTGTNSTTPIAPSAFAQTSGASGTDPVVQVKAAGTLLNGGSTSVTVSIDGVVVGVVPFTFTGKVAKVVLGAAGNGYSGAPTNAKPARMQISFYDGAGTQVYPDASAAYPQTIAKNANSWKGFGTSYVTMTSQHWPTSTTPGYVYFGCPSGSNVTDAAQMDYTNADGSVVTSNSMAFTCSGDADTYSAKLDKSTYKPGDIATLTVTFKDAKGSLANDNPIGIAVAAPVISLGGMAPVTAPAANDVTTNGVKTYTYTVGTSTGGYAGSVSFPTVNTNMDGVAQTLSYTIADGGTSLNDVLKGIVSLIASINKQIAALAKLVAPAKKK